MDRLTIGQDEPLFPARLVADRLAAISLRDICHISPPHDSATMTVRLTQFYALIRLVPLTVFVNLFNAALVVISFWGLVPHLQLVGWYAAMTLLCGARWLRARRLVSDPAYTQRRPTGMRSIVGGVGLLALCWAVP